MYKKNMTEIYINSISDKGFFFEYPQPVFVRKTINAILFFGHNSHMEFFVLYLVMELFFFWRCANRFWLRNLVLFSSDQFEKLILGKPKVVSRTIDFDPRVSVSNFQGRCARATFDHFLCARRLVFKQNFKVERVKSIN